MPAALVWSAATALVATFLWAAAAKIVRFPNWRRALAGYSLPTRAEPTLAVAVPFVELAAAALILFFSVKAGAALALSLLALFCATILRARAAGGDRLPCGCFGTDAERDYRALLVRNALLAVACALVLLGPNEGDLRSSIEAPAASEVLPAALVVAGVVAAWLTVRQAMGAMRRREHP